jgi:hypothetical protein
MFRFMRWSCVLLVSFAVLPGITAQADIIEIHADRTHSTENLGDFRGTLEYQHVSGSLGQLIVTLKNISDPGNGGFITGFLFNIDSVDPARGAALTSATHPFIDAVGGGLDGAPFGSPFDAGAAITGNWSGGGLAQDGIAVGQVGVFEFDIFAADAGSLGAMSFLEGRFAFNFVVRFRGFNDEGSDKVPAIPAPGSLALMGLGAIALGRRPGRALR